MYDAYLSTLTWYTGPGLLVSKQRFGPADGYEFIFNTPIEDGKVKAWHNNIAKAFNQVPSEEDVANAKMAQAGALAAFAQDFQIWENKRPAINIMATPVEGNFRLGRIWYKQFYNPLAKAAEYQDKVNGKHLLRSSPGPSELAAELEQD